MEDPSLLNIVDGLYHILYTHVLLDLVIRYMDMKSNCAHMPFLYLFAMKHNR